MRKLESKEITDVAGGNSTVYSFNLKPGVEVVGMEAVITGYSVESWYEPGLFVDSYFEVHTPIIEYYPIYEKTFTTTYYL